MHGIQVLALMERSGYAESTQWTGILDSARLWWLCCVCVWCVVVWCVVCGGVWCMVVWCGVWCVVVWCVVVWWLAVVACGMCVVAAGGRPGMVDLGLDWSLYCVPPHPSPSGTRMFCLVADCSRCSSHLEFIFYCCLRFNVFSGQSTSFPGNPRLFFLFSSGANLADVMKSQIARGLLFGNCTAVTTGFARVWAELYVSHWCDDNIQVWWVGQSAFSPLFFFGVVFFSLSFFGWFWGWGAPPLC